MKKKVKKFAAAGSVGGFGRFTEDSPSVEDMKTQANEGKGIFSGAAASDESDTYAPKTRTFSTTGPDTPKPKPRPKPVAKVSAEESARNYAKLEAAEKNFRPASEVMKGGQAGKADSGRNAALDKLMADREATASREARRRSAMVDKANAGVPEVGSRSDAVSKQFNDAASQREGDAIERRNRGRRLDKMDLLGKVIGHKKGGMTKQKSASARADGCALRGKTRA